MTKKKQPIHPKVKSTLGYKEDMSDSEFLEAWKKRAAQVCKPCWELKYCPYGPFVEQSPLLPPTRVAAIRHNEYLKECLSTGKTGTIESLDEQKKELYREIVEEAKKDPSVLAALVARKIFIRDMFAEAEKEGKTLREVLAPPMSDFEKYKVPYPLNEDEGEEKRVELSPEIEAGIQEEIRRMEVAIETGVEDNKQPLDNYLKKTFQAEVDEFEPEEYPESIPEEVGDMSCNIFGHICPVVFVGESITETTENRRKGRYIPFHMKIRVVRRDNYTCQKCKKHLRDDEVEFDHIIPVSKGGSSEEHNIRLTCFDCNREKSDNVEI